MNHATQVKILKELLRQLDNGVNVDAGVQMRIPASAYTCPDLASREWNTFFRAHPQMVGLSGDLPNPGSYLTVDDFGVSVLATRDDDGVFRAFLNACRHRGVRVASEPRGEASRFKCPFHHWTYSSRGELLGVPRQKDFGAIDRACHGLVPLPAEERAGLLWVHPEPDGVLDLDAQLGELNDEIAGWGMGDLVYRAESVMDMSLNWKLANDTFGETYHFSRLHTDTLGRLLIGDALSYEPIGRNHRFVFPFKAIDELRGTPEEAWRINRTASVFYYLFPNIQINVGPRHANVVRIYPNRTDSNEIDPGRSVSRIGHYFNREDIQAQEENRVDPNHIILDASNVFDSGLREGRTRLTPEASIEIFASTVEKEDYVMGESTQRTVQTGALEHLIFGRNEAPLHHFHNTFREVLGMQPLEQLKTEPGA